MIVTSLFILSFLLISCSNNTIETKEEKGKQIGSFEQGKVAEDQSIDIERKLMVASKDQLETLNQKVIYEGNMEIEVNDLVSMERWLNEFLSKNNGYIVYSNVEKVEKEPLKGFYTVRIPSENLHQFMDSLEEKANLLIKREMNGQDVTEEYVDLESRLKSKQVVESRLLELMKNAKDTEDLLKISESLAKVQEEIETIQGRMKYIDNRVDLATLSIVMYESDGSKIQHEFNTWEKTKKQFITSINGVLQFFSMIFVIIVGNSPIILLFGGILAVVLFVIVKKKRKNKKVPEEQN